MSDDWWSMRIDVRDEDGEPAVAVAKGWQAAIEMLEEAGVDVETERHGSVLTIYGGVETLRMVRELIESAPGVVPVGAPGMGEA